METWEDDGRRLEAQAAADQLLRLAHRRTAEPDANPHLLNYVLKSRARVRYDELFLPEEFTLGYYTPYYEELNEEEKLALNHWIYCVYYSRFKGGEIYVSRTNRIISEAIHAHQPHIARLLALESQEEGDHIQAFECIVQTVLEHYEVAPLATPGKPFASLLSHTRSISSLLRIFGVDYIVAYFLARGITNHQGVGYERPIAKQVGNPYVAQISKLHASDESQHMAVSQLLSQSARTLLSPHPRPKSKLYRRLYSGLQKTIASYAFSQARGNAVEIDLAQRALHRIPALRRRSHAFLQTLIQAHYDHPTGLQRSQNRTLARDNARILRRAAIDPEDRAVWQRTLREVQGHLHYVSPN